MSDRAKWSLPEVVDLDVQRLDHLLHFGIRSLGAYTRKAQVS